ncbi:MAG: hypothetical protein FJW90_10975 [Actinobacteria bacterium]|nr:hypothetical protein [Actinomycetota bacterium]
MGYSARYHAASLVAVFLALAVGILIGAGLGDNLVSDTEQSLRDSLEGDIEQARGEADELAAELERERAFSARTYPALVGDAFEGDRIGLLALGELSPELATDIEDALEPTEGDLVEVAVVRRPPDVAALSSELANRPAAALKKDPAAELEALGIGLGRQFALGRGKLLDRIRDNLFSRSSGEAGRLDRVILTRAPFGELDDPDLENAEALESGLTEGVVRSGVASVAVERSDAAESQVAFFASFGITTVDSVDLVSGEVAMVFALLGAEGNFGVKGSATSLLPELLFPSGSGAGSG